MKEDDNNSSINEVDEKSSKNKTLVEMVNYNEIKKDNKNIKKTTYQKIIKKISGYIFEIKDLFFMLCLLCAPCPNFNFLSLFYLFFGLLYIFLVSNNKLSIKNKKIVIEIIILIYSILCFFLKLILYKKGHNNLNLGIQDDKFFLTIIQDLSMIVISALSLCSSKLFTQFENHNKIESKFKITFYIGFHLFLIYYIISAFSVFHHSYISIFFMYMVQIELLMWSLYLNFTWNLRLYRMFSYICLFFYVIFIIITNLFNIESIHNNLIDSSKKEYQLNQLNKVGILYINNEIELNKTYVLMFFNYYCACFAVIFLSSTIRKCHYNIYDDEISKKNDDDKSSLSGKTFLTLNEKIKNSLLFALLKIRNYLLGIDFILHINRGLVIVWIYLYRNYLSFGLLIWLCFSFLYINQYKNITLTLFLCLPCMAFTILFFQYANIEKVFIIDDKENKNYILKRLRCLCKFEYNKYLEFFFINFAFYCLILLTRTLFKGIQKYNKKLKDTNFISNNLSESLILNNEEKDENKKEKDKKRKNSTKNKEKQLKLKFKFIIYKFFLKNIDKISLIAMYFVSIDLINISHFILVIIFMMQLYYPNYINKICYCIIITIEIMILGEYCFDIFKIFIFDYDKIDPDSNKYKIIEFIIYYKKLKYNSKSNIELLLFIILYCFYIQNIFYKYKTFQDLVNNDSITLSKYINKKFKKFPVIKKIIFIIGDFLMEFYVWGLIILSLFTMLYFEVNLLFSFKLVLFFIICYLFIKSIQNPNKSIMNKRINMIFLLFCGFNTIIVYIYQFKEHSLIGDKIDDVIKIICFGHKIKAKILNVIGISVFDKDKYFKRFFPHFLMNFLSILLYWETNRLLKKNIENNQNKNIINEDNKDDKNEKDNNNKNKNESIESIINKKDKDKLEEIYKKNKALLKKEKIINFFFTIIIYFAKLYWIVLFFITCIIYIFYDISFALIIYLMIFCLSFLLIYKKIIRTLSNFIKKKTFFISKLIRYTLIEQPSHIKRYQKYREKSFKILLIFSEIFILLNYLYGNFYIIQNGCDKGFKGTICDENFEKINFVNEKSQNYIDCFAYLGGFYVNIKEKHIIDVIKSHLLLFFLICFDVYIQKIQNYFVGLQQKKEKKINSLINLNADIKGKLNNLYNHLNISTFKENSIVIEQKDGMKENEEIEEQKNIQENKIDNENNTIIDSSFDISNENVIIQKFLNIFKKASNNTNVLKETNFMNKLNLGFKKIIEEFIIFLTICAAIAKMNVYSYVYMFIIIFFITQKKSMKKFYYLLVFLVFCTMIQISLFLSNLSYKIDPNCDVEMLILLKDTLSIPWYEKVFNEDNTLKFSYFLGLGANKLQIKLLFIEFVLIIVIYLYLEYFAYSIYQDVENLGQNYRGNDKINYFTLSQDPNILRCVKNLSIAQFNKHYNCMNFNFDINLGSYEEFQNRFIKKNEEEEEEKENKNEEEKNNKESENIENQNIYKNKKSKKQKHLGFLTNLIYLYSHNIILSIIIIISMMVGGLISITYIIFALNFLIKSTYLILGRRYYYPKAIKKVLRILLFVDIFIQLIIQSPLNEAFKSIKTLMKIIGLNIIINYDEIDPTGSNIDINKNEFTLTLGKAFTFFFMSLQVLIYSSQDFQEFYLSYILTKNDKIRRAGIMSAFLFNNKRVHQMKKSINRRNEMKKTMEDLEQTLEDWNSKLIINQSSLQKNSVYISNSINPENEITNERKSNSLIKDENEENNNIISNDIEKNNLNYLDENKVRKKIKEWIKESILIKIYVFLHNHSCNYLSIENEDKYLYEKDIIQGKIYSPIYIEKLIDFELNSLNLKCFTKEELKEVKKYFDGTKEKELLKKKKEEEKKNKKIKKYIKEKNLIKDDNIIEEKDEDLEESEENEESAENEEKEKKENKENKDNNNNIIDKNLKEEKNISDISDDNLEEEEKEEKKIEIDINHPKFEQFKNLKKTKLFKKYLKNKYLIKMILNELSYYFLNHFNYLCYIIMVINHMTSGSLLTIIYPFLIFCYSLLEYPRPTRYFWNLCLNISLTILIIKFVIQLDLLDEIPGYETFVTNLYDYKFGLKYFDSTFSFEFLRYILSDSLTIIFLLINDYLLVKQGIWKKREQDLENIYQGNERISLTEDLKFDDKNEIIEFNEKYMFKDNTILFNTDEEDFNDGNYIDNSKILKKAKTNNIEEEEVLLPLEKLVKSKTMEEKKEELDLSDDKYDADNRTYWQTLFPKIRNEKPGNDYYIFYTLSMIVIIIYLIFYYSKMEMNQIFDDNTGEFTSNKQFDGLMVILVIIHVILLVIDRVIYIKQNRINLKYKYVFIEKESKKKLSDEEISKIIKNIIKKEPQLKKKFEFPPKYLDELNRVYNITYIQKEEFNYPLLSKYILQIFILVFSHLLIFFWFPFRGNFINSSTIACNNDDPDTTCNNFSNNSYLILCYILYCIYLFFSGLQIKEGYYDMKQKSILMSGEKSINGGIYSGFKAIPFINEIKLAIDWTFTKTSLDLFQWAKFESVYDTIYITLCSMTAKKIRPIGKQMTKFEKILLGWIVWIILLIVLVGPMLLFSDLNPMKKLNNVDGASISIKFSIVSDVMNNFTLFENKQVSTIKEMNDDIWSNFSYGDNLKTKNYPKKQIQIIYMYENSDTIFSLAKPYIQTIIDTLNNTKTGTLNTNIKQINLYFEYSFSRPYPTASQTATKHLDYNLYKEGNDKEEKINRTDIVSSLFDALMCYNSTTNISLKDFYIPSLKLNADNKPKLITGNEDDDNLIDCNFIFNNCFNKSNDIVDYSSSYFSLIVNDEKINNKGQGIQFHTFSEKISTYTSSYDVVTFYVTFILLIGGYVKQFLSGNPEKIQLTEMPEPKPLINLCAGIKIARYSFELKKEENLYYILIEFMRSPEYLKMITKSSLDAFKKRKEIKEDDEFDL